MSRLSLPLLVVLANIACPIPIQRALASGEPEAWVDASIVGRYPVPWSGYNEYGYGWYRHRVTIAGREYDYFFASGNGGNKIYVFPEDRMLVVIQSAAYNASYGQQRSLDVLGKVLRAFIAANR